MIDLRLMTAILAGKVAGFTSRRLGRGGGTNLPGLVARRIDSNTLRSLSARLANGVILVAGTNGKTTTTRMIATGLQAAGHHILHNRAGANLVSGLTASMLTGSSLGGHIQADMGLFEVDEAALPQAIAETKPRLVLLHNLFRDQLDRYGEVDTIMKQWGQALEQLPGNATVLLNADDPSTAYLGQGLQARVGYYGLEDLQYSSDSGVHIADAQFCKQCGERYVYNPRFYAHIGHYSCPSCGQKRPQPEIALSRLELDGERGAQLTITHHQRESLEFRIGIPGLYNALNALAATAALLELGVAPEQIQTTLSTFNAAFGRIERVNAAGRALLLALIKNPIGASETIRMLTGQRADTDAKLRLLIIINDRHADGTDVSWLWDADFERLQGNVAHVVISGTRAADMAVRMKYAGIDPQLIQLEPDLSQALDQALDDVPATTTLYVLPTYTAMLELREILVGRGWVKPFWED